MSNLFSLTLRTYHFSRGSNSEFYICINSNRDGDEILFTHEGGVDIGDVDAKALRITIPVGGDLPSRAEIKAKLLSGVSGGNAAAKKEALTDFVIRLYNVYSDLHFAYVDYSYLVIWKLILSYVWILPPRVPLKFTIWTWLPNWIK